MYTINSKLTYIFRNLPRDWIFFNVLLASLIWSALAVRGGPLFPGYTCSASVISSPGSHWHQWSLLLCFFFISIWINFELNIGIMDSIVLPHPVIFLFLPVPSHSFFVQLGPVLFIHPRTFSTCYFMLQQKTLLYSANSAIVSVCLTKVISTFNLIDAQIKCKKYLKQ